MPTCDFTDYEEGDECGDAAIARLDGVPGLPHICKRHYECLANSDNAKLLMDAKILDPASPGKDSQQRSRWKSSLVSVVNALGERASKLENARQSIFYARVALAPMVGEFQSVEESDAGLKIIYEHLGKQIEKLTGQPPIARY